MFPTEEIATNGHPKPAILCLHGGGTNSTIFDIQMIRIKRVLHSQFNFVFLDAPFHEGPGPGVIPTFEGMEPYLRWSKRGVDEKPAVTEALIQNAIEEQRRKDGVGFVGVLGFSQGARTTAGLLLEQQLREKNGETGGFKFGVVFNGTCPPLTANLTEVEKLERIRIPSLVVVGTDDPWRPDGVQLFKKHFDSKTAVLMEFGIDHRLPILSEDTLKVTDKILEMYRESTKTK